MAARADTDSTNTNSLPGACGRLAAGDNISGASTAGVKFPPPLIFGLALLAAAALDRTLPIAPGYSNASGISFVAAGILLDLWAVVRMGRVGTTILPWGAATTLVTDGPFRLSRNPIYLGYALEYVGGDIVIGSWWAWPLLLAMLVVMDRAVIRREERHLAATFGAEYDRYRARVRRWI